LLGVSALAARDVGVARDVRVAGVPTAVAALRQRDAPGRDDHLEEAVAAVVAKK